MNQLIKQISTSFGKTNTIICQRAWSKIISRKGFKWMDSVLLDMQYMLGNVLKWDQPQSSIFLPYLICSSLYVVNSLSSLV